MQYIIDIPEHMKKSYEDMIKHCDYKTFEIPRIVVKSIANGKPLPKGHGKIADIDAIYQDICDSIEEMTKIGIIIDGEYLWGKLNDAIDNAPTIIEKDGD